MDSFRDVLFVLDMRLVEGSCLAIDCVLILSLLIQCTVVRFLLRMGEVRVCMFFSYLTEVVKFSTA